MPAHPRYASLGRNCPSWAVDDPRNRGYFSRRHRDGDAHFAAVKRKEDTGSNRCSPPKHTKWDKEKKVWVPK